MAVCLNNIYVKYKARQFWIFVFNLTLTTIKHFHCFTIFVVH
ncbi:hypothetical protein AERO8C_150287 [Aeromonas veronii]|uniref:Uncharacterized protein n=1 Tax=Aeromonas veronii TaxID=654 RepID=A0A653KY26_AERVE|nr:hypothetical protein AERO8C_150287 [Aeromonas veronii]